MLFKALLIIFLTIATTQAGCPTKCNCTTDAVTCITKRLECVPNFDSLTNHPVIIDISGNKINYVSVMDLSFDKSDEVLELYLNNSEVVSIENQALDELTSLQELYLGKNLLNEVPEHLISKQENIIVVDLSNNNFLEFPKLISLSLEFLAVANSQISTVPSNSLKDLPNLRVLYLQQNNIKYISPAIFQPLEQFFVKLSFNSWICNCETVNLFEYLSEVGFIDVKDPVQCLTGNKEYINILENGGIVSEFKTKCRNTIDIKEVKFFEDLSNMKKKENEVDKPYSLVILQDKTIVQEPQENQTFIELNDDIVVEKNDELLMTLFFLAAFILGLLIGLMMVWVMMRCRRNEISDSTVKLMPSV